MLIEIEGPRGAGKSTLIETLCADAGRSGLSFVRASEVEEENIDPGWILAALMRAVDEPLPAHIFLFMYGARTAARARLSSSMLAPGVAVLSDRLSLSLYVQARISGTTPADAWTLVRLALHGVTPDCTVLLDADYSAHLQRLKTDGREPQPEPGFQATRVGFTQAYDASPTTKIRVNTTGMTPAEVRTTVLRRLSALW